MGAKRWFWAVVALMILAGGCKKEPRGVQRSLHDAAAAGDLAGVQKLLSNGADVNARDREGYTALHHAAKQGRQKVVRLLIEKGVDVKGAGGPQGETPLHAAVRAYWDPQVKVGRKSMVQLLVAAGADVNASDANGATRLHWAAFHGSTKAVEHLLAVGASANVRTRRGETPLHMAVAVNSIDRIERLVARGADVNAGDQDGWTPLHVAAFYERTEAYQLLVAHGANQDSKTNEGTGAADLARDVAGRKPIILPTTNEDGPFAMIVTHPGGVAGFLWWDGIDFERVWIPDGNDLTWTESVLRTAFNTPAELPTDAHFETEYVRTHLHRYNCQYAGFISKGRKYILSNMYLLDPMEEDLSVENIPSSKEYWAHMGNGFMMIYDGGGSAVRALFDVESRTLAHIECNGR